MTRLVTVARPYAKAIIMSATTAEEQTAWSSVLSYLSLMVQDAQIGELLKNPGISRAKIKNIFLDILSQDCGLSLSKSLLSKIDAFLQTLIEKKRLPALPNIAELYHELLLEQQGIIEAEIASPFPLTAEQQEKYLAFLSKHFKREISLKYVEDKSLLGGVLIRIGQWVWDASIKGRLRQLSENLS